jgi:tetratricopeptide (TPR) repeat protein
MEESCSAAMAVANGLDSPNTAGALVDRGAAHLASDELDAAISDLSAAIQINPKLAPAYADRALAYLARRNFAEADADMDRSFQLRPDDFRSYNLRCWVHAIENKSLDAALADCNAALQRIPNEPHALDSLGVVQMRRGHYAEAVNAFDEALKRIPDNAGFLYLRGLCERKLGYTASADTDTAAAKAKNPQIEAHYAVLRIGP